jgi:hypothetical protein
MFGLPIGLLIRVGGILLLSIALLWGWHKFTEHYRDEGRAEVQAKWDADKDARIKRTTEITLMLSNKLQEAMDAATKRQTTSDVAFAPVAERANRVHSGTGIVLPADVAGVLNSASGAANANRPDAGAKAGADPVPIPTQAQTYDERELADFFVKGPLAYADAYNLWRACRDREDSYLAAMAKGASNGH